MAQLLKARLITKNIRDSENPTENKLKVLKSEQGEPCSELLPDSQQGCQDWRTVGH